MCRCPNPPPGIQIRCLEEGRKGGRKEGRKEERTVKEGLLKEGG
jgi:hypothetical protein